VTQPNCTNSKGTVSLSGLPASWVLNILPGGAQINGTGSTYTVTNLSSGTYNFAVKDKALNCVSLYTNDVIVNPQPATPSTPLIGAITHPTCFVPGGSVVIGGLPTGSWTLTMNPGAVTTSGSGDLTVVSNIPAGVFTFTVTDNNGGCTSLASPNVVIIPNITTPATPVIGKVVQPTCADNFGSIALSSLPANWVLTMNPGAIVTNGSGTNYTVSSLNPGTYSFQVKDVATNCVSLSTSNVVIDVVPNLPAVPVCTVTQPNLVSTKGIIDFTPQTGVEYSIGGAYQLSPTFNNLMPNTYTLSVRNIKDTTCQVFGASTVTIQTANPQALDDVASVNENDAVSIPVSNNDAYGTYGPAQGPIVIATDPVHGIAIVDNAGTPNNPTDDKITYTPTTDYFGVDSLTYTICTSNNLCSTATVRIDVHSLAGYITVTKKASLPKLRKDGTYGLKYTITIANKTADVVKNIQLEDDLQKTFVSPITFDIESIISGNKFTLNSFYDGKSNINMLSGNDQLQAGQSDSVVIQLQLHPNAFVGSVFNQAIVNAVSLTNGPIKQFRSNDGSVGLEQIPTVTEIKPIKLYTTNAFTPNGDGFNDNFVIIHSADYTVNLQVFDRWGSLVFQSTDYHGEWFGKGTGVLSDQDLPTGTYYYVVKLLDKQNNLADQYAGYVTLKR
jgi:gliding motility-associated-like protein